MTKQFFRQIMNRYREGGIIGLIRSGMYVYILRPITNFILYPFVSDRTISDGDLQKQCFQQGLLWEYDERTKVGNESPQRDDLFIEFEDPKEGMDLSPHRVCEISNATIIGKYGISQTESNQWIFDSMKWSGHLKRILREDPVRVTTFSIDMISGLTDFIWNDRTQYDIAINLITHTYSDHPYGHWLVEYLPKLLGLTIYEQKTGRTPTLLINKDAPEWMIESLNILGYEEDRIEEWNNGVANINTLVVPITGSHFRSIEENEFSPVEHQWVQNQYRNAVELGPTKKNRIFISRQGFDDRRISNIKEIKDILDEYNFDIIRPEEHTFTEQIRMFGNASCIVGHQGSGLHNMIFAKESNIVEIFPPEYTGVQNFVLSNELGHKYTYIVGEKNKQSKKIVKGYSPFDVDADELRSVLDCMTDNQ